MNIDRETIKQYLSQLTPSELAELAAELRADWRLPEPSAAVLPPKPIVPAIVGYDVVLTDLGSSRVATIRALRAALGVDLRAARDLTSALPVVVRREATETAATALADALREAGATAQVEPAYSSSSST
jgi:large subunit ribosomal protein L7/L12